MHRDIGAPASYFAALVQAGFVFGVHADNSVTVRENAFEVFLFVDQQAAGAATHEYLDAAGVLRTLSSSRLSGWRR